VGAPDTQQGFVSGVILVGNRWEDFSELHQSAIIVVGAVGPQRWEFHHLLNRSSFLWNADVAVVGVAGPAVVRCAFLHLHQDYTRPNQRLGIAFSDGKSTQD